MYVFLDYLLNLLHGGLILFNLTGWIWQRTRRFHLISIGLTFLSWFAVGVFYGWGYCPLTDWHWDVKRQLGELHLPNSYIKYHLDQLTGSDWQPFTVDVATLLFGLAALLLSTGLNWRDNRRSNAIGTQ